MRHTKAAGQGVHQDRFVIEMLRVQVRAGRDCRWREWMSSALSPPSIPRLRSRFLYLLSKVSLFTFQRDALEKGTEPPTAPQAQQHKWLPTAPGVCSLLCVCVCSLMCVCTLDGINAEHEFSVWVTILGRMSHHLKKHKKKHFFLSMTEDFLLTRLLPETHGKNHGNARSYITYCF